MVERPYDKIKASMNKINKQQPQKMHMRRIYVNVSKISIELTTCSFGYKANKNKRKENKREKEKLDPRDGKLPKLRS